MAIQHPKRTTAVLFMLIQPLLSSAQSNQSFGCDGVGPWHMWAGAWGMWWIFPMFMFLFFIVCATWLLFGRGLRDRRGDSTFSALQILNERFARGEMQKPEYEEKKASIASIR
jgi:putative membrane protein